MREMPLFRENSPPEGRRTYARPRGSQQIGSCDEQLTRPRGTPQARPSSRPRSRRRILAAASALILVRGFDSMTVDEVASAAGVGKATVSRRWARKEDLAVAAMEQLYRTRCRHRTPVDPRGPAGDVHLGAQLRELANRHRLHPGHDQESLRDERTPRSQRDSEAAFRHDAIPVFKHTISRGKIRADTPVTAVCPSYSAPWSSCAPSPRRRYPRSTRSTGCVDFVLNGITT